MSTLFKDKKGLVMIQFHANDGKVRTIRLGRPPMRHAEMIKIRVEELISAQFSGCPIDSSTAAWISKLEPKLAKKLQAVGLIDAPMRSTLGDFLDQIIEEKRAHSKPASIKKLRQAADSLIGFFGRNKPLHKIAPSEAVAWEATMRKPPKPLSEATIRTRCGNAKTMLHIAVQRKMVPDNPFQTLRSGTMASDYRRYVEPDEIAKVIAALPNAQYKLLFGLARYGGLRTPSETNLLKPEDVDFKTMKLRVRSPKTEHHAGKGERYMPILPELLPLLEARLAEMTDDNIYLIRITGNGCITLAFNKACKAAGVEPWKKPFQILRSSCEQELGMKGFPEYVTAAWLGHSTLVARKHYTNNVPPELYDRASRPAADQNRAVNDADVSAVVGGAAPSRTELQGVEAEPAFAPKPPKIAAPCDSLQPNAQKNLVEAGGIEPPS